MKHNSNVLIDRLRASKDGKTVAKNFGFLSLLQITSYVFPLITMPYLANVIGKEGFGKIAFAAAVIMWVETVADWGFNFSATRDISQNRDDKDKVSRIFSNVFWARLFLSTISGLILLLLTLFVPYLRANYLILLISFLMIPGHILFPEWFFQGIERMKYTTILNLGIKIFFTVAVFLFIKEKEDYIIRPLLTTIGYVVCGLVSLYLILYKWNYNLYPPKFKYIFNSIVASTDVFINNLMPNLYNSFSVMLLGFWGGPSGNGIYDGGVKFVEIARSLQNVLSRAFFPFLARRSDKHYIFVRISLITAVIMGSFLFVFSPLIVNLLLSSEFQDSVLVLRILSVSLIGLALNNSYGTNYLILQHHEKELKQVTIIASIIGLILSFPLVYYFTYIGAAITITVTRLLLGILVYYKSLKYITNVH